MSNKSKTQTAPENRERLLETITGRDKAERFVLAWVQSFNEGNGAGRMRAGQRDLEYWDDEGSGEFIHARCINCNEAENRDAEIYEIFCLA